MGELSLHIDGGLDLGPNAVEGVEAEPLVQLVVVVVLSGVVVAGSLPGFGVGRCRPGNVDPAARPAGRRQRGSRRGGRRGSGAALVEDIERLQGERKLIPEQQRRPPAGERGSNRLRERERKRWKRTSMLVAAVSGASPGGAAIVALTTAAARVVRGGDLRRRGMRRRLRLRLRRRD